MAIKSLQHSSLTDNIFYRSVLAGNDAFFPEFESDDFLEEVVLSTTASSVTFSGLGTYATAGYKHLQIRMVARSNLSSTYNNDAFVTFNSDTAANYSSHNLYADGYNVYSGAVANTNYIAVKDCVPAANTPAYGFAPAIVDILDFSNIYKNTTTRQLSGAQESNNNYDGKIVLGSGLWNNTAAITAITITYNNASFVSGSRFSLYASKG